MRKEALEKWLKEVGCFPLSIEPLVSDASFRRYFRLYTSSGTLIAMDAPPALEDSASFIAIAQILAKWGVTVPDIMAVDLTQGFLLISDLGDATYLSSLTHQNADPLYDIAMNNLILMQHSSKGADWHIPSFNQKFMWQEWEWHKEWFLQKFLGLSLVSVEEELDHRMEQIIATALSQPQVFIHRDYHSANLMVLPHQKMGVLDFQDAFIGPLTYDLVSLLRDCYIAWPEQQVNVWTRRYWEKLQNLDPSFVTSYETFVCWFDWMGVQRHLKALFIFSRKQIRDHQSKYLRHIPRTLNYVKKVSERHPQLASLHEYYSNIVQPAFDRVSLLCGA